MCSDYTILKKLITKYYVLFFCVFLYNLTRSTFQGYDGISTLLSENKKNVKCSIHYEKYFITM